MIDVFELVDLMEQALPVQDKSKGYTQLFPAPADGYVRLHWTWFKYVDTIPRSYSMILSSDDQRDVRDLIKQAGIAMRKM